MKILQVLFFTFLTLHVFGQTFQFEGEVFNSSDNESLPGANIVVLNTPFAAVADENGKFEIAGIPPGKYEIRVSFVGFKSVMKKVNIDSDKKMNFSLEVKPVMTDEVIVSATRAEPGSPTTFSTIGRQEIEEKNLGRDIPYIMQNEPSTVVTSDAGGGVGYTGIRIRGSDPSRINVTINGIPLNDSESQTVFWVDLPDFSSSVEDIQIQRGVGTSTNGAGAFGGSINVQTLNLNKDPYASFDESIGSFSTFKHTISFGTGLIKNRFALDGRLSQITSDGYIDRASSNLRSLYLSGGYYDDNTTLKGVIMLGKEVTYQAWYGVSEDDLTLNRTFNLAGTDFLAKPEPYENEVDDYRQDHYQLLFSQLLSEVVNLNIGLHYTKGRGFFEQYKVAQSFADYNLSTPVIGNDTIFNTDLIRRRWLDNDFFGTTFSVEVGKGPAELTIGGAWNKYVGDHFGEIIWAQFASDSEINERFYDNTGDKTDFNIYAKASYRLSRSLKFFLDLQYRRINYDVEGLDIGNRPLLTDQEFNFFNPKAGISYRINNYHSLYASAAIANREPVRNDIIDADPGQVPGPERMYNIEAGYSFQKNDWMLKPNLYLMYYTDQLVLTGRLNDVGAAIRTNVDQSYRVGLELIGEWSLSDKFKIFGNITLSKNKINVFEEYINTYNEGYVPVDSLVIVNRYENTDISFSPDIISSMGIHIEPFKGFSIDFTGKYVGRQYLDNTSQESRSIDPFYINDLLLSYTLDGTFFKDMTFRLAFYNIFDVTYETGGYTFSERYVSTDASDNLVFTGPVTYNYYYPQAGFNIMGSVSLNF